MNLLCLVKGHLGCYCSCGSSVKKCCGCMLPRGKGRTFVHCLDCGLDITKEYGHLLEKEFNPALFLRQGAELNKRRAEIKRGLP